MCQYALRSETKGALVAGVLRSDGSRHGLPLLLRPWSAQDIPGLLDIYRDPVMRASSRNPLLTEQDACRWLERQLQGWTDGGRLGFAVLEDEGTSEPSHVLGGIALKGYKAGKDAAEVGYWTAAADRNRGVASQAVQMLTTWAFESLGPRGLHRIDLLHREDNPASCQVARKSGYALVRLLPPDPPAFPVTGHLHARYSPIPT
jgi:RimJ/RimL family protein N-acetyltransferase